MAALVPSRFGAAGGAVAETDQGQNLSEAPAGPSCSGPRFGDRSAGRPQGDPAGAAEQRGGASAAMTAACRQRNIELNASDAMAASRR